MKIKSSITKFGFPFALLVAFMLLSSVNIASATITSGSVTPSSTADYVVGTANADYKISFISSTSTATTLITVQFPTGYTITSGAISTSNITAINGNTAAITVGNATSAITAATGTVATRSIAISMSSTLLTASTTSFYILAGITNATTSGATATSSITTNAEETTSVAGNTLTMGALTLSFTTQPASATSGIAFVTQPKVTAQDQYANVSSTYASIITLSTTGFGGTLAGGTTSTAVSGSSTFSGVKYTTSTDNGVFFLTASDGTLSTTSTNLTARIVATKLVFTTQPSSAYRSAALSTQPAVSAQDADGGLDVDFTSIVTLTPTSTTAGSVTNGTATAVAGIASFGNVYYVASASGESFMLAASGGGLITGDSASRVGYINAGGSGTAQGSTPAPITTSTPTPAPTPVTPTPVVAPAVTPAPSATPDQQQQLNALMAQLKALVAQASALGIAIPDSMKVYLTPSSNLSDAKNLSLGAVGSEVKMLQQFLNTNGFMVTASGPGSSGNETTRFGPATKSALAKYQASVGVSPARG
ncbi:MAG: peptidoglycan-binding domain-containing protein, partial [Patescibacteria group bacterium]